MLFRVDILEEGKQTAMLIRPLGLTNRLERKQVFRSSSSSKKRDNECLHHFKDKKALIGLIGV
jgi:hypothetical protein